MITEHIYLFTEPPQDFPFAGIVAHDFWRTPRRCGFHPLPDNEKLYHGYMVSDSEIAAGLLIRFNLEPVLPSEWALFQFWEAMKYHGKEAAILKALYHRTSLKDLRKQYKDPANGADISPEKIDQNRRLAWAALILRGKADLSHIKLPEVIGS